MKKTHPKQYRSLRVGDDVLVISERGRQREAKLKRIHVLRWTADEIVRLRVPPVEVFYETDDGKMAGQYDRVMRI